MSSSVHRNGRSPASNTTLAEFTPSTVRSQQDRERDAMDRRGRLQRRSGHATRHANTPLRRTKSPVQNVVHVVCMLGR